MCDGWYTSNGKGKMWIYRILEGKWSDLFQNSLYCSPRSFVWKISEGYSSFKLVGKVINLIRGGTKALYLRHLKQFKEAMETGYEDKCFCTIK